jgi:hypothetical protein
VAGHDSGAFDPFPRETREPPGVTSCAPAGFSGASEPQASSPARYSGRPLTSGARARRREWSAIRPAGWLARLDHAPASHWQRPLAVSRSAPGRTRSTQRQLYVA